MWEHSIDNLGQNFNYFMIENYAKRAFPEIYFENLEKYDGRF